MHVPASGQLSCHRGQRRVQRCVVGWGTFEHASLTVAATRRPSGQTAVTQSLVAVEENQTGTIQQLGVRRPPLTAGLTVAAAEVLVGGGDNDEEAGSADDEAEQRRARSAAGAAAASANPQPTLPGAKANPASKVRAVADSVRLREGLRFRVDRCHQLCWWQRQALPARWGPVQAD